jgi:WD40 repeat protein
VAFSSDNTLIVSGSWDKTIRIWDARTGAPIGEPLCGQTGCVVSVAISHDSTRIVSGSSDRAVRIWDALTGDPIGEPLQGHTDIVYSVVFSPDSSHIFSASPDRTICVWQAPQCDSPESMFSQPESPSFDMITSKTVRFGLAYIWHRYLPDTGPTVHSGDI